MLNLPFFQVTLPLMVTFIATIWLASWSQNKRIDEMSRRFDDRFDGLEKRFEDRFQAIEKRIDDILARLTRIEQKIEDLTHRVTMLETVKWR